MSPDHAAPPSPPQICAGDVLVSIDGSKAVGLAHSQIVHSQIVRKVRGAPGTRVALGLRRPREGSLYVIELVRGPDASGPQSAFGSRERRGSRGLVANFIVA